MKRHCSVCGLPGHTKASHKRRRNPPQFKGAKKDEQKKLTPKQAAKQFDQRWLFDDPRGIGGYEQHQLFSTKKNPGISRTRTKPSSGDFREMAYASAASEKHRRAHMARKAAIKAKYPSTFVPMKKSNPRNVSKKSKAK